MTTRYRVYMKDDSPLICGEYATQDEACQMAATEPGFYRSVVPFGRRDEEGVEDPGPDSWHGETRNHYVVRVRYDR